MFVCPECGLSYDSSGFCPDDGNELCNRGNDTLLGSQIGPYRVASIIGEGGMGTVYKGNHPTIGSRVAIKVLNAGPEGSTDPGSTAQLVDRFFSEARAVNLIRHENIVNILDFSSLEDGRPYITMEFLDGVTLADLVDRDDLPLGSVAALVVQVLEAIGAAHATNVVHRDLKPDNIFVTPAGRAKVLDFGVAKLDTSLVNLDSKTRTGSLLGTPYYMAPEQARGEPVGPHTDIYAIGAILFEAVTGRRVFEGKTLFEILSQHVDAQPDSPRTLRSDLPKSFERLILKALAKKPKDRFQNTDEMVGALREVMSKLPSKAFGPLSSDLSPRRDQTLREAGAPAALRDSSPSFDTGPNYVVPKRRAKAPIAVASLVLIAGGGVLFALSRNSSEHNPSVKAADSSSASSAVSSLALGSSSSASTESSQSSVGSLASTSSSARTASRSSVAMAKSSRSKRARPAHVIAPSPSSSSSSTRLLAKSSTSRRTTSGFSSRPPQYWSPGGGTSTQLAMFQAAPAVFDYQKYKSRARREAKAFHKDTTISMISIHGMKADGRVHAKHSGSPYAVMFNFVSKTRKNHIKSLPPGAVSDVPCAMMIAIGKGGHTQRSERADACPRGAMRWPRCEPKTIWQKAIAIGAPKNGIAQLSYHRGAGDNVWDFRIGDVFSETFQDDC